MKIINGAYIADSGTIWRTVSPVKITSPQDAQREGVGMVYQELNMLPDLNVTENIFISHLSAKNPVTLIGRSFIKRQLNCWK